MKRKVTDVIYQDFSKAFDMDTDLMGGLDEKLVARSYLEGSGQSLKALMDVSDKWHSSAFSTGTDVL